MIDWLSVLCLDSCLQNTWQKYNIIKTSTRELTAIQGETEKNLPPYKCITYILTQRLDPYLLCFPLLCILYLFFEYFFFPTRQHKNMVHIKDLSYLICKAEKRLKWNEPGMLGPGYEEVGSSSPHYQGPCLCLSQIVYQPVPYSQNPRALPSQTFIF